MFGTFIAIFAPGLAPQSRADPTKPFHVQSFTYFTRHIYALFLGYAMLIQLGDQFGISCVQKPNEIADFMCLMGRSYTIRAAELRPGPLDPLYLVAPGVGAFNANTGTPYHHFTNYIWIDIVMLLQIFLFQTPDMLWSKLRARKHASMFAELDWNVPDCDFAHEHAERHAFEKCGESLSQPPPPPGEPKSPGPSRDGPSCRETVSKSSHIRDIRIEKLLRIARSHFALHLAAIKATQFAVIIALAAIWDLGFAAGNGGSYNFSLLGPRLISYWLECWRDPDEKCSDSVDPAERLFPTIVKCDFRTSGGSGDPQTQDRLCALEANYVFEKMLTFTWFYYAAFLAVLAVVTVRDHLYLAFPAARRRYIRSIIESSELTPKLARFQRKIYRTEVPAHFDVPYQVALFAVFLERKIGKFRAKNVLKQFLIVNEQQRQAQQLISSSHSRSSSCSLMDKITTFPSSDSCTKMPCTTASSSSISSSKSIIEIGIDANKSRESVSIIADYRDNLYGDYIAYYREVLNWNLAAFGGEEDLRFFEDLENENDDDDDDDHCHDFCCRHDRSLISVIQSSIYETAFRENDSREIVQSNNYETIAT